MATSGCPRIESCLRGGEGPSISMPARHIDLRAFVIDVVETRMGSIDKGDLERAAYPVAGQASATSAQADAESQWARNLANMQALYKQNQSSGLQFMPPNQLAAYYANAAHFTPLLYNAHMVSGLSNIANPYAFLPASVNQSQQLPAHTTAPSAGLPAAAGDREHLLQDSQGGSLRKKRKQNGSAVDLKEDQSEPSKNSGSLSPASELGSEQLQPAGDTALTGDPETQPTALLGTSGSGLNLAGSAGAHDFQDEREAKKMRRKQSNRESARRSRLRKQAECEALSGKVVELQQENVHLKETNSALLARIEELVTKLEQRSAKPGMAEMRTATADIPAALLSPGPDISEQLQPAASQHPSSNPSTQTHEHHFTAAELKEVGPQAALTSS